MAMLVSIVALALTRQTLSRRVVFVGDGYVFRVEIPTGWRSKEGPAVVATIWPEGKKLDEADASIVIEAIAKRGKPKGNFERAIDEYLTKEKAEIDGTKVLPGPTLETVLGQRAFAFFVDPPDGKGVRRCASFLDSPKIAFAFLLCARSPQAYNAALAAYVPLVKSFGFVTDNVKKEQAAIGK